MTDGIIKGTGDSRYLKGAGWPATYAEFKAMAEAGTLPFDLNGINEAGWQQIGDALNKGNLLSDTTAAKLNYVTTVDAALSLLGRFQRGLGNEYVWAKYNGSTLIGYVNSPDSGAYPPTVSDGYAYMALGQIGNKVRIATVAYAGTGSKGGWSSPAVTVDFGFPVKLVLWFEREAPNNNAQKLTALFWMQDFKNSTGYEPGANGLVYNEGTNGSAISPGSGDVQSNLAKMMVYFSSTTGFNASGKSYTVVGIG